MATGKWTQRIATVTILLALGVLFAGPLVKFAILPWQAGLALFALGSLLSGIGALIALIALLRRRGGRIVIAAALFGGTAAAAFALVIVNARSVPPIHDITTDTANPPQFASITPSMRGGGSNSLVYDPANAPLQKAAYPAIATRVIDKPMPAVFDSTLKAIVARGWTVVTADAAVGRIEATETANWWGFKDDIVVRLAAEGAATRIDVRSVSRVGQSDFGANAKRIKFVLEAAER